MMLRRVWITTLSLVSLTTLTVGLDGCIDDGVGVAPEDLFTIPSPDAASPAVTSTDTPGPPNTPPPPDGGNTGPTDAGKKPDVIKPPVDSGTPDTGTPDTGDPADSGAADAEDDSG